MLKITDESLKQTNLKGLDKTVPAVANNIVYLEYYSESVCHCPTRPLCPKSTICLVNAFY